MKTNFRNTILTTAALTLASAASAIPTWMGVYGGLQRHTAGNPGSFSILMNQDYFGLNAEVGVKVDNGPWTLYPMSYTGNVDGNSKWQFTPDASFEAGSNVTFYFHGYDNVGGNIWDSANGANYSFTVPSGTVNYAWSAPSALPTNGYAYGFDIAAYNGTTYAVWTEGDYPQTPKVYLSKKTGGAWTAPVVLDDYGMYPSIAVSESGIHVFLQDMENSYSSSYIRSTDDGQTWSAPIQHLGIFSPVARYANLYADADYVYCAFNDFTAPETSRIKLMRKHKDATAFEPAADITTVSSYKTTAYPKDLVVRGRNVFLTTMQQSWYGGFTTYRYHQSVDSGATWSTEVIPGQATQLAADMGNVLTNISYNTGPAGGGLYASTRTAASAWSAPALVHEGNTSAFALQPTSAGLVLVTSVNGQRVWRTSTDNGATWSEAQNAGTDNYWVTQDVRDGDTIVLLVNNEGQYYTVEGGPAGSIGGPIEWVGNAYNWPFNGNVTAEDNLWINIESYPAGNAVSARVVYSVNGGAWASEAMSFSDVIGNNDWWHVDMGTFNSGDTIQYAIEVIDGNGASHWDNNGGTDFFVNVN